MSLENLPIRDAEPVTDVRRRETKAQGKQPRAGHSNGVDVGGTAGSETGERRETSNRGTRVPTSSPSCEGKAVKVVGGVGVHDSSEDTLESITNEEPSVDTWGQATGRSEGQDDGSGQPGIRTSEKVRKLQTALYRKAKGEPKYRFYSLYGDICREDVLAVALTRMADNDGAAGVDGEEPSDIVAEEDRKRQWLGQLRQTLRDKTYRASAVRRVYIPKADGKLRPLGIPTLKDRVVQMAVYLVLMPILEADFHPNSFGFRPKRGAHQAMKAICKGLYRGYTEVVDADLSAYFDTIPHRQLMRQVAKRVSDGSVLALIRAWLRAPVVEEHQGKKRVLPNRKGTPQGGVISPLLANLYLDQLDHAVAEGTAGQAMMVRYADDLVIMCRSGKADEMRQRLARWLEHRQLSLNEEKTRIVHSRREGFCFLGFSVTWRKSRQGRNYVHVEPSVRSRVRLMDRLRRLLHKRNTLCDTPSMIGGINRLIQGWGNYFRYENGNRVFSMLNDRLHERVRCWLWHKHRRSHPRYYYTRARLREQFGLYPLQWRAS